MRALSTFPSLAKASDQSTCGGTLKVRRWLASIITKAAESWFSILKDKGLVFDDNHSDLVSVGCALFSVLVIMFVLS